MVCQTRTRSSPTMLLTSGKSSTTQTSLLELIGPTGTNFSRSRSTSKKQTSYTTTFLPSRQRRDASSPIRLAAQSLRHAATFWTEWLPQSQHTHTQRHVPLWRQLRHSYHGHSLPMARCTRSTMVWTSRMLTSLGYRHSQIRLRSTPSRWPTNKTLLNRPGRDHLMRKRAASTPILLAEAVTPRMHHRCVLSRKTTITPQESCPRHGVVSIRASEMRCRSHKAYRAQAISASLCHRCTNLCLSSRQR